MVETKLKNWALIWMVGGATALAPILIMEGDRLLTSLEQVAPPADLVLALFFALSAATVVIGYVISRRRSRERAHARRYGRVHG